LTFAATLQPFYNAYGAFSADANAPGEGLATVEFNASFGSYHKTVILSLEHLLTSHNRFLPSLHGPAVSDLLHLLTANERCLRFDLLHARPRFWLLDWCILEPCHRLRSTCCISSCLLLSTSPSRSPSVTSALSSRVPLTGRRPRKRRRDTRPRHFPWFRMRGSSGCRCRHQVEADITVVMNNLF
jgi:hypothetical protein